MKVIYTYLIAATLLCFSAQLSLAETRKISRYSGGNAQIDAILNACPLEITFGSYAMGVDHELKSAIISFIETSALVAQGIERSYGKEGESKICLNAFKSKANAAKTALQIKELIDAGHSKRAPTSITFDGLTYSNSSLK